MGGVWRVVGAGGLKSFVARGETYSVCGRKILMAWCPKPLLVGSCWLIPVTRTLVKSNPQHCTLQRKKNCVIRVGPDLFRLVNIQCFGISLVEGGESIQFHSL